MMIMIKVFKVIMVRKILKQVFGNSYAGGGRFQFLKRSIIKDNFDDHDS